MKPTVSLSAAEAQAMEDEIEMAQGEEDAGCRFAFPQTLASLAGALTNEYLGG